MFKGFKAELKENRIAKALQIIGWVEMIAAIIVMIFSDIDEIWGVDFNAVIWVSAFITYYIFLGFAEIIDLLHKNGKRNDAIYDLLKECISTNREAVKSINRSNAEIVVQSTNNNSVEKTVYNTECKIIEQAKSKTEVTTATNVSTENSTEDTTWVCAKCNTRNLLSNNICWRCNNPK